MSDEALVIPVCQLWAAQDGQYHLVPVIDGEWPNLSLCEIHMFSTAETKTPGAATCEACIAKGEQILAIATSLLPKWERIIDHPLRQVRRNRG